MLKFVGVIIRNFFLQNIATNKKSFFFLKSSSISENNGSNIQSCTVVVAQVGNLNNQNYFAELNKEMKNISKT